MTDTEYYDLIRPYDDAMKLLLTRLEILNHNIYKASAENPIHTMQYRIKSKQSIEEKLIRKGEEPWAAMEHRISYKKEYDNREQRVAELLSYADTLVDMEKEFEKYNENATLS